MTIFSAIKKLKIWPKLILMFMIAIVPLFFVSLQFNRLGTESVRKEIWSSMEARVRFNIGSLEAEMARLMRLHTQYALDNDLTKLSSMSSILPYYEVMLMQKRVQNKLWILETSSLYIAAATAYIPLINKTLLPLTDKAPMTGEEIKELQELAKNRQSPIVYWNGKLVLNTIYPDPSYYASKPPLYVLQSELDRRGLQVFLLQMTGNNDGGAILFTDRQEWGLSSGTGSAEMDRGVERYVKLQSSGLNAGRGILENENGSYYIAYERSELLDMTLALYIPEEKVLGPLHKYRIWFRSLFGIALVVVVGFSYWIYRSIHSPLRNMIRAFRKVEKGDLTLSIAHKNYDEFHYLYNQFNIMVKRLQQSMQEVYESKIMAQQSELKQLQSQINPHFLYNTYYMVHRMARTHDMDNVEKATKYLGDYFVYITRNSSSEADLGEEWDHTVAYLEIQQMRFQSRIEARIECASAKYRTVRIPRLILQPIVENAYQHGLQSKTEKGVIVLSLHDEEAENVVVVTVEENGESLTEEKLAELTWKLNNAVEGSLENTGIVNVHKRLLLKFGEAWGIVLSRSALGGLKVSIRLPVGESKKTGE